MSRGRKVYLSWSHFKQRGLERRVQSSEPTAGGVVIKDDQFSKAYLEVPEIRPLGKRMKISIAFSYCNRNIHLYAQT